INFSLNIINQILFQLAYNCRKSLLAFSVQLFSPFKNFIYDDFVYSSSILCWIKKTFVYSYIENTKGDATDVKFLPNQVEWAWEALQHGEDSFLVAFPSEEELARMTLQRIRREDIYQNFLPNNDLLVHDVDTSGRAIEELKMEINTKDALKYMDFEEMG
ncbi:hypothetical protein ACJX0J_009987, partial [Zea mays]